MLIGRHRIVVDNGALPPGYLLDRTLERIISSRPMFEFVVEQIFNPDPNAAVGPHLIDGDTALDHLAAYDTFELPLAGIEAGPGYRSGPAALIISERVAPRAEVGFVQSVDIVDNPRRVLARSADGSVGLAWRQ
jgi:hypothetical protein